MREINSLELLFLTKDLKKSLVGSKIQKIKQIFKNTFLFELYKQKRREFLILSNEALFSLSKSYESQMLTNLCQTLRKRLIGQIKIQYPLSIPST